MQHSANSSQLWLLGNDQNDGQRTPWLHHLSTNRSPTNSLALRSMSIVIVLGCSKDYNIAYPKHTWNTVHPCISSISSNPLSITLPNQATACSFLCLASRNFFVSWQLPQGLPSLPGCLNIIHFHTWKPVRWTCISAWLDIKYCGKIFAQGIQLAWRKLEHAAWRRCQREALKRSQVFQSVLAKRSLKCSRTQETYVLWASFKCRVSKARNEVLTKAPAATQYVLLVTKAQNVLLNGDLCTSAA